MVATAQGQTLVRVTGPANGAPVVLLHGIGGNSLQWVSNVEELSRGFRVYTVDAIYDYGRSLPSGPLQGVDEYTGWLRALLDGLDLDVPVNLVGLSYGGWLASQFALRNPERVRRLALVAPVGTVLPLRAEWIARAVLCALPHPHFTRRFLHWLAADLAARDEQGRRLVERWAEDAYVAERSFQRRSIAHPTVLSDEEWQRLRMPVLFLVGENERIYSAVEAVERLRRVAPHVAVERVPDAGHDLTLVQAERVNRSILGFLGTPLPPAAATAGGGTADAPLPASDREDVEP